MISLKYFLTKMKDVKGRDIAALLPMTVALIASPAYKQKYKDAWLICEEPKEARDNGYWFFRKMCENHPEQKCVYAINHKSPDYKKVKKLGETVEYGSFKHWLYYFCAAYNISSQKGGKPNAALCSFFELNDIFKNKNVFLQHGVIINDVTWLYSDKSKIKLFITSAVPETDFIREKFGYPPETIQMVGLARFDNLHNAKVKRNRIVIMPTWRYWFNLKSKEQSDLKNDFLHSKYYHAWRSLLEDEEFNHVIEEHDLEVIFYPHRNMQQHVKDFKRELKSRVKVASWKEYDIQELLKSSAMMITDYSSVFFDMVYMKKPVLFYQFDLEDFRRGQYESGYFDYAKNAFGKSCKGLEELRQEFICMVQNGFQPDEAFLAEHERYFTLFDEKNCERTYQAIKRIRS